MAALAVKINGRVRLIDNGLLLWIDATGKPVAKAQLAGAVRRLYAVKTGARLVLVAGTDTGDVVLFHSRSDGTPIPRDGAGL